MPVPAVIATAAENFRFNSDFLVGTVKDLSPEEWLSRPEGKGNHIAWLVGHVTWTRARLLGRLQTEWTQPWLGQFARGEKLDEAATYPSPEALGCVDRGFRRAERCARERVRRCAGATRGPGTAERRRQGQRHHKLPCHP